MRVHARRYYRDGTECAKCILLAAAVRHQEITEEVIATSGAIANGFGVGILCGCVVSALMVLSAVFGETEAKERRIFFMTEFKERFGSLNCSDICEHCCNCEEVLDFVCQWLENEGL